MQGRWRGEKKASPMASSTRHAELAEIGHQEVAHPGHGARQSEAEAANSRIMMKRGRRHHPGALHPLLHAAPHEPPGQAGKQQVGSAPARTDHRRSR